MLAGSLGTARGQWRPSPPREHGAGPGLGAAAPSQSSCRQRLPAPAGQALVPRALHPPCPCQAQQRLFTALRGRRGPPGAGPAVLTGTGSFLSRSRSQLLALQEPPQGPEPQICSGFLCCSQRKV